MSKVDELKEKLNGFIEELKKKLPSKGRKQDSDDDEELEDEELSEEELEDDFDEATGKVEVNPDDLKDELDDLDDEGEEGEEDEDIEEDDEEEKKKKQKKLLINGLLVVIIIYLSYDQFIGEGEAPTPTPAVQKQTKPVAKKPKKAVKKKPRKVKKEQPVEKPTPAAKVTPVPTPVATPVPTPVPTPKPTPMPTPEPTAEPAEEPKKIEKKEAMTVVLGEDTKLGEKQDTQAQDDSGLSSMKDAIKKDLIQKSEDKKKIKESLELMEEDMDYVAPPNYKRLGRGLVYNCIDKHWACVDKFAYFQCRENFKYNKGHKKKAECVVKNVYASVEDCSVIQTHYINMGEPTGFCEGEDTPQEEQISTKIELNGN